MLFWELYSKKTNAINQNTGESVFGLGFFPVFQSALIFPFSVNYIALYSAHLRLMS